MAVNGRQYSSDVQSFYPSPLWVKDYFVTAHLMSLGLDWRPEVTEFEKYTLVMAIENNTEIEDYSFGKYSKYRSCRLL